MQLQAHTPRPSLAPRPLALARPQAPATAATLRVAAPAPVAPTEPSAWRALTGPFRWAGHAVAAAVDLGAQKLKALLGAKGEPGPLPADPKGRAVAAMKALDARHAYLGAGLREHEGSAKQATVWPYGQAIAGALNVGLLTGDTGRARRLLEGLKAYHDGQAYTPGISGGDRLWDDNAWIGLDFLQAHAMTGDPRYLAQAEGLFPFMQQGLHREGGLYWEENNPRMSRNTCGNGPAIQYALKLYAATQKPEYLAYAKGLDAFMNAELRLPNGLYADNLGDDGSLDPTIYSYNQGTPIGADVQWFELTRDPKYLRRAESTASAALKHFTPERLWGQSPAFNAIFFRNLMQLDRVAPKPEYRAALNAYAERLAREAHDPATGLYTQGSVGSYTRGKADLLDQGGVAQIFALQAMTPAQLAKVA